MPSFDTSPKGARGDAAIWSQLPPAAVHILLMLESASQPMEFGYLAQRSGLDTSILGDVLRGLNKIGAIGALEAVPGLQPQRWVVTEAGYHLSEQLRLDALRSQQRANGPVGGGGSGHAGGPVGGGGPVGVGPGHGGGPVGVGPGHGGGPVGVGPGHAGNPGHRSTTTASTPSPVAPYPSVASYALVDPTTHSAAAPYANLRRRASRRARKARNSAKVSFGDHFKAGLGNRRRQLALLLVVSVVVTAFVALAGFRSVNIEITGVEPGVIAHRSNLADNRLNFDVAGGRVQDAKLELDGLPVSGLQRTAGNVSWVIPPLTDGAHTVSLVVPRKLFGAATGSISFTIDSIPPDLGLPEVHTPVPLDQPFVLTGQVAPDVVLQIDGVPIDTSNGTFTITHDLPPAVPISFVAVDAAGNTSTFDMVVPIAYPPTTGVHVTAAAWDHDGLREGVIDLITNNKITAVQLDLKDERGLIGYTSSVPLAQQIGASQGLFALDTAIDELHALGVRVIGRIVAFRDPALGRYAVRSGNTDWVLQNQNGNPLPTRYGTGAFTNFSNDVVRQYNLDIAREAAEAGIDDVLWDYMRRPEGDFSAMVVPGFEGTDPSPVIVSFLAEAGQELRAYQVYHGVSVFGIAARRGIDIAQDIRAISDHVDYVSPMLYPSHWGNGEYGVEKPESQPYDIIRASLEDFQRVLEGTSTMIVPWLQDFSIRVSYGPDEVEAQINAAADAGISNWLLWDPTVTYTVAGIPAV